MDWVVLWVADTEREPVAFTDEVDGGMDGDETLRCWGGVWGFELLLDTLWLAEAFPGTVCRRVRGGIDDEREVLGAGDVADWLLSVPSTSFNEIFGLLVATCHGDDGVSSGTVFSAEGVGLANCCCCCFFRSRCDNLPGRLPGAISVR